MILIIDILCKKNFWKSFEKSLRNVDVTVFDKLGKVKSKLFQNNEQFRLLITCSYK